MGTPGAGPRPVAPRRRGRESAPSLDERGAGARRDPRTRRVPAALLGRPTAGRTARRAREATVPLAPERVRLPAPEPLARLRVVDALDPDRLVARGVAADDLHARRRDPQRLGQQ